VIDGSSTAKQESRPAGGTGLTLIARGKETKKVEGEIRCLTTIPTLVFGKKFIVGQSLESSVQTNPNSGVVC